MWQRFTERARKVIFYAQEEAQRFGEGYVATEHMLLGLIREPDSVACLVLQQMGVRLEKIRSEVESQLARGETKPSQDMTLTPRAKRVIDLAYDEARNLNNNYIGTEHVLLGLIREGDGLAGRVFAKLNVTLHAAREVVQELQAKGASSYSTDPGQHAKAASKLTQVFQRKEPVREATKNLVLLIYSGERRDQVHQFLQAIGLMAIDWDQHVELSGSGGVAWRQIRDTLLGGIVTLVIFTPDENGLNARPDMVFDAGFAMGSDPGRTVLTKIGECRLPDDDLESRTIPLDNSEAARWAVINALSRAGCTVDTTGTAWATAGDLG